MNSHPRKNLDKGIQNREDNIKENGGAIAKILPQFFPQEAVVALGQTHLNY
ncbi:hypothetical protein [Nostoc sp. C117]|uniref:hypothetical protein n=1 Tax=Nostoc sp. C117 TaxID=3349875 RepID=UPI00370DA0FE